MAKAQVQTLGWNVRSRPARTADHLGLWPRRADTYHPRHEVGQGIRKSRFTLRTQLPYNHTQKFPNTKLTRLDSLVVRAVMGQQRKG